MDAEFTIVIAADVQFSKVVVKWSWPVLEPGPKHMLPAPLPTTTNMSTIVLDSNLLP